MIGIQDGGFKSLDKKVLLREETRARDRQAIQDQLDNLHVLYDHEVNPTNFLYQIGKLKYFTEFDGELKSLNPNLSILPCMDNENRAWVYNGSEKLLLCERLSPEWSVLWKKKHELPVIYDGPVPLEAPSTVEFEVGWSTRFRGWREVLLRLVQSGHLTLGAVEKKFGSANRLSWAKETGKQRS